MNPTAGASRVGGDLVADHRPAPGHQVDHARRQIGRRRCTRRAAPRTRWWSAPAPDDGVAVGERRRDDLAGHRVRPVPRADQPRRRRAAPASSSTRLRGVDRRRQQPLHPGRLGGRHLEVGDQLGRPRRSASARLAACPGRGRACARGPRGARRCAAGDAPHRGGPVERRERPPMPGQASLAAVDRPLRVGPGALGHRADHLAGRRAASLRAPRRSPMRPTRLRRTSGAPRPTSSPPGSGGGGPEGRPPRSVDPGPLTRPGSPCGSPPGRSPGSSARPSPPRRPRAPTGTSTP